MLYNDGCILALLFAMQYDTVLQTGVYTLNYIRDTNLVKEKAGGEKLL